MKNIVVKFKALSILIASVALLFSVNLIGDTLLKKYDVDFTQDSIFALSKGTANILANINEPIQFRFFYSRRASNGYPTLKSHAERIRAILERYASVSGGKIKLEVIDPEAFTDDEDLALSYGIKGIDLNNGQEKLYLGLAITNAKDDTRAIAFFHPDRQRFVEYEVTKAIYDLQQQKRPAIGLLSSIEMESKPMMGIPGLGGGQKWLFLEQLSQSFDIINIDKNANKIPANIDVLMVVQPKDFSLDTLGAIDQYVLSGGKSMVFVDPYKEGVGTGNQEDRTFSVDFNKLLGAWGVEISPDTIVADRKAARPVQQGEEGKGKVDYIAWLNIGKDGLNKEDISTSILKNVNFATAGAITELKTPGINITPLIKTSLESMLISRATLGGVPDPNKLLSNFISAHKEYNLAVKLSGNAKSAFQEQQGDDGHLSESKGNINVVLVADTDILRDDVWAQTQDIQGYKVIMQNGDNSAFVNNIIEYLSGSEDLISLRGRGAANRPFTVVDSIKKTAEEQFLTKEKALKDRLAATEERLAQLKKQADSQAGNKLIYQSQQQQEIYAFTDQMAQTRKELRNVQFELKKDVDYLGSILKFINILLMPLLIILFAIFVFVFKGAGNKA